MPTYVRIVETDPNDTSYSKNITRNGTEFRLSTTGSCNPQPAVLRCTKRIGSPTMALSSGDLQASSSMVFQKVPLVNWVEDGYVSKGNGIQEFRCPVDGNVFFSDVTNSDISQSISSQIVKQVSRRANVTFITSGVGGVNVQETFQSVVANTILQLRKSLESTLINDAEDKMQESNNRVNSYPHGSILGTSIVAQDTKQLMSYGSMAGGTSVPNLNMSSLPRQSRAPTPPTSTRRSIGGQRPASARTVFQTTTLSPRSTSPNQRFLYLTSHSPKYFVPSQAATRMFTPRADSTDQLPSTTRAKVVDDPTTPAQASTRKTPRKQRRCSLDIAKELHNVVDGVMSRIPNSAGRCKLDSNIVAEFNGKTSYFFAPNIPGLTENIGDMSVDFLMRTNITPVEGPRTILHVVDRRGSESGQTLLITLNGNIDKLETKLAPYEINVLIRDKVFHSLEVTLRTDNRYFDNNWHHVMIHWSLSTNKVRFVIDGKLDEHTKSTFVETPRTFEGWSQHVTVGASYLLEEDSTQYSYAGQLTEFRILSHRDGQSSVLSHFPFDTVFSADHGSNSSRDILFVPNELPPMTLEFQGSTCVNIGTLKTFGEALNDWEIEVTFSTRYVTQTMCLFGVTDSGRKHQEILLVLNAEPTKKSTNGQRYTMKELVLSMILVDSTGHTLSAKYSFEEERVSLADGHWHTIQWRVNDATRNQMSLKVDFKPVEITFIERQGPAEFIEFTSWLAIGAHNIRNATKVSRFQGLLARVKISVQEEPYASWNLDEGPGATLAIDDSMHGFHGTYYQISGKSRIQNMPHSRVWIPRVEPLPEQTTEEFDKLLKTMAVIRYSNNHVAFAFVHLSVQHSEDGSVAEVVYDCTQDQIIPCQSPDIASTLPDAVFHNIKEYEDITAFLQHGIANLAKRPPGHLAVILQVGDSRTIFTYVTGPVLAPISSYDSATCRWIGSVTNHGVNNKRNLYLNVTHQSMERLLFFTGVRPRLFKKLEPFAPKVFRPAAMTTASILPLVVYDNITKFDVDSEVFTFFGIRQEVFEDEAQSFMAPYHKIITRTLLLAIVMIQRNTRKTLAKRRYVILCRKREEDREKNQRKAVLRKNYSSVAPAQKRRFLIGCLLPLPNDRVPHIPNLHAEKDSIAEIISSMNESVSGFETDTSSQEFTQLVSTLSVEEFSFVYVAGYGAYRRYRRSIPIGIQICEFLHEELCARLSIHTTAYETFDQIRQTATEAKIAMNTMLSPSGAKGKNVGRTKGGPMSPSPAPAQAPSPPAGKKPSSAKGSRKPQKPLVDESTGSSSVVTMKDLQYVEEPTYRQSIDAWALKSREELFACFTSGLVDEKKADQSIPSGVCHMMWASNTTLDRPTPFNTVSLETLCDKYLGATPEVGRQKILVVEAPGVGCEIGFGFVGCSNGLRAVYNYTSGQKLLLSHFVKKALRGNPQPNVKPKQMPDDQYKIIDADLFFEYIDNKMTKMKCPGFQKQTVSTFVADIVVCQKVLMSAADRKLKRTGDNTRKACHVTLLVNGNTDISSSEFSSQFGEDLRPVAMSSIDPGRVFVSNLLFAVEKEKVTKIIAEVKKDLNSMPHTFIESLTIALDSDYSGKVRRLLSGVELNSLVWVGISSNLTGSEGSHALVSVRNHLMTETVYGPKICASISFVQRVLVTFKCAGLTGKKLDKAWRLGHCEGLNATSFEYVEDVSVSG